jgi:hypothetical protein
VPTFLEKQLIIGLGKPFQQVQIVIVKRCLSAPVAVDDSQSEHVVIPICPARGRKSGIVSGGSFRRSRYGMARRWLSARD